jgi:hypothetical protein
MFANHKIYLTHAGKSATIHHPFSKAGCAQGQQTSQGFVIARYVCRTILRHEQHNPRWRRCGLK